MVATNFKKYLITFFLLIISVQNAFADMMEKGKTKIKTLFNIYSQNSKSGKQVFDNSGNENATVIEPQIFVKHQITSDTEINASFVLDVWTAESDTILDGKTGASGEGIDGQARFAPNIGIRREIGKLKYGANLGFSSEYDYTSKNLSLDLERSFAEDNFTVGLSLQYYADSLDLFKDLTPPGSAHTTKDGIDRDIYALNLGFSQILTRKDIVQLSGTYAYATGSMESTAGTIDLSGTREVEILPGNRKRTAISSKWVHAFNEESAMNLSYRNYFDDWGMHADTIKAAYLFSLRDEADFIEISLRYHTQDAVDYYKDRFFSSEKFMTSDSDISKFHSLEPAIMYTRNLGKIKFFGHEFEDAEWGNTLSYGKRNSDFKYGYVQSSLAFFF